MRERSVAFELGHRELFAEWRLAWCGQEDEPVLVFEPHRGHALLVHRTDGVERGGQAGGYLLGRCGGGQPGGNGLQAGEVICIALGTNPGRTLGLEGMHPFQRDCETFCHELEKLDVELVEVGQLPAAYIEHTEDALFKEDWHGSNRSQTTVAQHRRDDVYRRQVVDQKGLPCGNHPARHALAAADPEVEGDLFAEAVRCPGHELVPGLVGNQHRDGVSV